MMTTLFYYIEHINLLIIDLSFYRISLSNSMLQVIKPPFPVKKGKFVDLHIGKSEKGVYCALVKGQRHCRLKIWFLDESCSHQMRWVLKHDASLIEWVLRHDFERRQFCGPWTLQDINYYYNKKYMHQQDQKTDIRVEETFEWDSGDEDLEQISNNSDRAEEDYWRGCIEILGFHPYKEIIFLSKSLSRGLAYHWNSSKVQDLGTIWPTGYQNVLPNSQEIRQCFPYTPCWII